MATTEGSVTDRADDTLVGRRPRRPLGVLAAVIAAAVGVGLAIGWLSGRGRDDTALIDDPGIVHVHGLGINPSDGALYAATHTGLFRLESDGGRATRIADRYQDTMGFTVVGPDRFLASGHPDLQDESMRVEGKPPLLGLIESTDAGRTWRARSLLGDADLHTIVAVGHLLVAYDSTGERVLASSDGGRTWDTRSQIALTDLAVDPTTSGRMAAITIDGAVDMSYDGGRTWTPATDAPGGLTVMRWRDDALWAGGADGTLHRWDPPSGGWTAVHRFDGPV